MAARAMRQLNLEEYQNSGPLSISHNELEALLREAKTLNLSITLSITPAATSGGEYVLKPDSTVGAVENWRPVDTHTPKDRHTGVAFAGMLRHWQGQIPEGRF